MASKLWIGATLLCASMAYAQSDVRLGIGEVIDNRMRSSDSGALQIRGGLEIRANLEGADLENVEAARVVVTEAKDDRGNSLLGEKPETPDFSPRNVNGGMLQFSVGQPSRDASSVRLKGTIELFVPSRDPAANVKIENALAKSDVALSHAALKAAKIDLTPLSREGYSKLVASRKLTPADVERVRAEGKAKGASDEEIEMMLEFVQAMDESDRELPPNAVALSAKRSDFDRIYRIEILDPSGEPVDLPSRSTSTRGDSSIMVLQPSDALPAKAALQLLLLTEKTRVSIPFDVKVDLP